MKNLIKQIIKESIGKETQIETIKNITLPSTIEGRFLNKQQAQELQKEIEAKYVNNSTELFNKEKNDIRMHMFNYDQPIAEKNLNGINLRITTGLIRNKKITYLLYANGKIIGEFFSVDDIKKLIKYIELNLITNKPLEKLNEKVTKTKVICDNCGWSWKIKDGGDDPYVCHKCGHDNTPKKKLNEDLQSNVIFLPYSDDYNEELEDYNIDEYDVEPQTLDIAKQNNLNILRDKNLKGFLFDTTNNKIVGALWTSDDNNSFSFDIAIDKQYQGLKLSHLLIKNAIEEYNAQSDYGNFNLPMKVDVINPMLANILKTKYNFRVVKKISNDRVIMSLNESDPKVGTGKKPKDSDRRLYTDENPKDTVSVKFKTKQDIIDTLNKASFKSKSHQRQSQIINLIHQRLRVALQRAKDPDVKRRLKIAFDYIESKKEQSKNKTQQMKEDVLNEKCWKGYTQKGMKTMFGKKYPNCVKIKKKKSRLIKEEYLQGKTIINVDIQPEYKNYISFNLNNWIQFLNENASNNRIIFLYNGYDTLGMVSENEYKNFLIDLGLDEDVLDNARFYDKGYAFFRYCMDSSIDEDNIVDLVKFMIDNNINDSRDIDEDMWNEYMQQTNHTQQDVRELLENAGDMINIPDLMDFLKNYSNIVLLGGGVNECLKEVEIALLALNKNFNVLRQFTY